ncbi:MAG: hypothetical protein Fur0043_21050 [Anaerolineales bacterium]
MTQPSSKTSVIAYAGSFGPPIFLFTLLVLLIDVALAFGLSRLPETYAFWRDEKVLASMLIFVTLGLFFSLLPALIHCFRGRVVADESGLRWNIRGKRGEILWARPFLVRRWWSVIEIGGSTVGEIDVPVLVYEISQAGQRLTFYRQASQEEIQHFPRGELKGWTLLRNARVLTDFIDEKL